MRTHVRKLAAGAALAMAVGLLAGPGGAQGGKGAFKTFLPGDVYKELVTRAASIHHSCGTASIVASTSGDTGRKRVLNADHRGRPARANSS